MVKNPYSLYSPGHEKRRPTRVADLIKAEVSMLLLQKINDPRIKNRTITITRVEVTGDLRNAKIYYSVLGDDELAKEVEEGLVHAKGFIRKHLAHELKLKYVPAIDFKLDKSLKWQEKMENIFKKLDQEP